MSDDSAYSSRAASPAKKRAAAWDWDEDETLERKRRKVEKCTAEEAAKLTDRQEIMCFAQLQTEKLLDKVSLFRMKRS